MADVPHAAPQDGSELTTRSSTALGLLEFLQACSAALLGRWAALARARGSLLHFSLRRRLLLLLPRRSRWLPSRSLLPSTSSTADGDADVADTSGAASTAMREEDGALEVTPASSAQSRARAAGGSGSTSSIARRHAGFFFFFFFFFFWFTHLIHTR